MAQSQEWLDGYAEGRSEPHWCEKCNAPKCTTILTFFSEVKELRDKWKHYVRRMRERDIALERVSVAERFVIELQALIDKAGKESK